MSEIYKVNDIFYSLEGEGTWAGFPTTFIRMSGCNLNCMYCDENFDNYARMTTEEIIEKVNEYPTRNVRITGGEPLLQDITELMQALDQESKYVAIETNGTQQNDDAFLYADLISCDVKGPSAYEKSDENVIIYLYNNFICKTEFKFVISHMQDLDFYREFRDKLHGANIVLMCNSNITDKWKKELIDEILRTCPEVRYSIRLQCVLGLK